MPWGLGGEDLPDARYLYFTGYMWDTDNQREAAQAFAGQAKDVVCRSHLIWRIRSPSRDTAPVCSLGSRNVEIVFGNRRGDRPHGPTRWIRSGADSRCRESGSDRCDENRCQTDVWSITRAASLLLRPPTCLLLTPLGPEISLRPVFSTGLFREWIWRSPQDLANRMGAAIVAVEGCNLDQLDRPG